MPEREEKAFQAWMKLLDNVLSERLGVFSEDLPDMPYDEWFVDGLDVNEVVDLIKEELEYED